MDNIAIISSVLALGSASCWFRASFAKVTREQVVAARTKLAQRTGTTPNLAGVSYNGIDPFESIALQSKWNAFGATLAGLAVLTQVVPTLF